MMDYNREDVIEALEYLLSPVCTESQFDYCDEIRAAIAFLKKQELKMVVQTTSTIRCPGCGKQITNKGAIHKEIKYCWKCGQAVKWDD